MAERELRRAIIKIDARFLFLVPLTREKQEMREGLQRETNFSRRKVPSADSVSDDRENYRS